MSVLPPVSLSLLLPAPVNAREYARASKGTERVPERDRGSEHEDREERSKWSTLPKSRSRSRH